jgi:hypothetical protein
VGAEHERGTFAAAPDEVPDRVLTYAPHRLGAEAAHEQALLLADRAELRAPLEDPRGAAQLPR